MRGFNKTSRKNYSKKSRQNRIEIVLTTHAIRRIRERCANLENIIHCVENKRLMAFKRGKEYVVYVPNGRFIGIFEQSSFVVKTFLFPFEISKKFRKPHSPNVREFYCNQITLNGVEALTYHLRMKHKKN